MKKRIGATIKGLKEWLSPVDEPEELAGLGVEEENEVFKAARALVELHIGRKVLEVGNKQIADKPQRLTHVAGGLDALMALHLDLEDTREEQAERKKR